MIDVKELLVKYEGLLKGHFCLTSGLHSDTYFQCACPEVLIVFSIVF